MQTVAYLGKLPVVKGAVGSALLSLGDGNWKMGEGVQVGKGSKLGEGDEQTILEHYVRGCLFSFKKILLFTLARRRDQHDHRLSHRHRQSLTQAISSRDVPPQQHPLHQRPPVTITL
jgi:hypothetical protein